MRINEVITENQSLDELNWGSVGRGLGSVARGVGAVAGVPSGIKQAFQQGKQKSINTIAGAQPAATSAPTQPAATLAPTSSSNLLANKKFLSSLQHLQGQDVEKIQNILKTKAGVAESLNFELIDFMSEEQLKKFVLQNINFLSESDQMLVRSLLILEAAGGKMRRRTNPFLALSRVDNGPDPFAAATAPVAATGTQPAQQPNVVPTTGRVVDPTNMQLIGRGLKTVGKGVGGAVVGAGKALAAHAPTVGQGVANVAQGVGTAGTGVAKAAGDIASQTVGGIGQTAAAGIGGLVHGYKTARAGGQFGGGSRSAERAAPAAAQTAPADTSAIEQQMIDMLTQVQDMNNRLKKLETKP